MQWKSLLVRATIPVTCGLIAMVFAPGNQIAMAEDGYSGSSSDSSSDNAIKVVTGVVFAGGIYEIVTHPKQAFGPPAATTLVTPVNTKKIARNATHR